MNYLQRLVRRARLQGSPLSTGALQDPFTQEAPWNVDPPRCVEPPASVAVQVTSFNHPEGSEAALAPVLIEPRAAVPPRKHEVARPLSTGASLQPLQPAPALHRETSDPPRNPLALADTFMQELETPRGLRAEPPLPAPLNPQAMPTPIGPLSAVQPRLDRLHPAKVQPPRNVEATLPQRTPAALPAPVGMVPITPLAPARRLSAPRTDPVPRVPSGVPQIQSPTAPARPRPEETPYTTVVALPASLPTPGSLRLGAGTPHIGLGQL
jgi:hypothetical protein